MLKSFRALLGDDEPVFRRYLRLAVTYGLLCGLTITTLVPVLSGLLTGHRDSTALWLVALLCGTTACWMLRSRVEQAGVRVAVSVLQGTRHRLGDHIARLPTGWFTAENSARLGHVSTQGVMAIAQLPAHVFTPVISGLVTPLALVAALLLLHWPLGLVALITLPLLGGAFLLTVRLAHRADQAFHHDFADVSHRMVEFAQAQSTLRAFSGEGGSTRLLRQALDKQRRSGLRLIFMSTLATVLNGWAVQLLFTLLLITAAIALQSQLGSELAPAEITSLVIALLLTTRFMDPLREVAGYGEVLRGARAQLDALAAIFAVEPLPQTQAPQLPRDASVELVGVHFRYAPDEAEVLDDVHLRIAPGSMTALIGESGSGKTTLLRLIARSFDVRAGCVRVGGVDVRQLSEARLAGQISQIFQDTYLFAGTIAENIRLGKPDASDADLLKVAQQAGVAEIIKRLPQGIHAQVGEGGALLSGGERQRVAIARALIKDAPILLVDEATAALDGENQAAIAAALARLRGQRTLIVIAHQLSTVAMADQIVVLDNGRIVEQGAPAQLQKSQGHYSQFLQQRNAAKGWRVAPESADRPDL